MKCKNIDFQTFVWLNDLVITIEVYLLVEIE